MIRHTINLSNALKNTQSLFIIVRKTPIIAVRLNEMESEDIFTCLKHLDYTLYDLTASNYPGRFFCNPLYYLYEGYDNHVYLSVLAPNLGLIHTGSIINFSALVTERECFEMYGVIFLNHPDLRKLLLDYGSKGNPLLKNFALAGYSQLGYTVEKGLIFQLINLSQMLRIMVARHAWYFFFILLFFF